MQRYYDIVAKELRERRLQDGLWARALAETGGNDSKARARYIKLRAEELMREEEEVRRKEDERIQSQAEIERLEGLRTLQEEEEREFSRRAKEGPSLLRVFLIVFIGFALVVTISAIVSAFRR